MDYSQFIIKIKEDLQKKLGGEVTVDAVDVPKNNGVTMQGIAIKRPGERVVPTIYLERFYADYLEGRDLEDIEEEFVQLYEEQGGIDVPDVDFFRDYEKVKRRLAPKLIDRGKNRAMLSKMPHRDFLDMAVVFYCLVDSPLAGTAAIMVRDEHMKNWGISVEQLYADALENAQRMLPGTIRTMEELFERLVSSGEIPVWEWKEEEKDFPSLEGVPKNTAQYGEIPLLILTNSRRYLGAACILYGNLLEQFAKKTGENFFILPSSVHEVILLPESKVNNSRNLLYMVVEVNRTQLAPEEVLTDTVYYYDRASGKIRIYAEIEKL